MIKFLFVICLLLVTCSLKSQNSSPIEYNQLERKGTVMYLNDKPYTGRCIAYDAITKVLTHEQNYKNGLLNGIEKQYYIKNIDTILSGKSIVEGEVAYKQGNLSATNFYIDGKLNGEAKAYYEDGTLMAEAHYIDGRMVGEFKTYNEKGKLIKIETYSEKGKLLSTDNIMPFPDEGNAKDIFVVVDTMPEFVNPEGLPDKGKSLAKYIRKKIKEYNPSAKGMTIANFVIEKDGHISDITIIKKANNELDNLTIKIIAEMPPWKPGVLEGKNVKVSYNLPFHY